MATATTAPTLILTIAGTPYGVEPIGPGEEGTKAYRLSKASAGGEVYDVIRTHHGLIECTCPHYEMRLKGNTCSCCKHGSALVAFGLMDAPAPTGYDTAI